MEAPKAPTGWSRERAIFSFKTVHFDALWGTFYTNCNYHYDHDINSNVLKFHMLNSAANDRPRIVCTDFSGGLQPP